MHFLSNDYVTSNVTIPAIHTIKFFNTPFILVKHVFDIQLLFQLLLAALSQVILCNITQPLCFTKSLEITLYQRSFFEIGCVMKLRQVATHFFHFFFKSPFGNVEFHSTPALLPCLPSCLPACSAKTAKFRDRKREREREREKTVHFNNS